MGHTLRGVEIAVLQREPAIGFPENRAFEQRPEEYRRLSLQNF